jgi:hypothetical protein
VAAAAEVAHTCQSAVELAEASASTSATEAAPASGASSECSASIGQVKASVPSICSSSFEDPCILESFGLLAFHSEQVSIPSASVCEHILPDPGWPSQIAFYYSLLNLPTIGHHFLAENSLSSVIPGNRLSTLRSPLICQAMRIDECSFPPESGGASPVRQLSLRRDCFETSAIIPRPAARLCSPSHSHSPFGVQPSPAAAN